MSTWNLQRGGGQCLSSMSHGQLLLRHSCFADHVSGRALRQRNGCDYRGMFRPLRRWIPVPGKFDLADTIAMSWVSVVCRSKSGVRLCAGFLQHSYSAMWSRIVLRPFAGSLFCEPDHVRPQ